jgi:DNA-binding MarR family transcriptional regulator
VRKDYGILTDLLRENHTQWQQLLEPTLNELGVTFVDRIILDQLAKSGSISKNELAKLLGTMHQNLTRSIGRLELQGLLVSQKSASDMRQVYLDITPKGENINNIINTKINECWNRIFSDVSNENIEQLTSMLTLIKNKLVEIE